MNGREAVIALMQGKKVRRVDWPKTQHQYFSSNGILCRLGASEPISLQEVAANRRDWELFAEPLSDEQLITEWEKLAQKCRDMEACLSRVELLEQCIRQLRERKL
jgi:hypothetical protein